MDDKQKQEIWQSGFEAGVAYVFSHVNRDKFKKDELLRFADFIELKCSWKTFSEWYEMIRPKELFMKGKEGQNE